MLRDVMTLPKINVADGVYGPREDSYLLQETVEKFAHGKVLDMGTGTGIQGITAALKDCNVVFTDINPIALRCAQGNAALNNVTGIFIVSDLFSEMRGRFDVIVFNPPYLPDPDDAKLKDMALDGGANGRKYIDRFLDEYKQFLAPGGFALLVESSLNGYEQDVLDRSAEIVAKKSVPSEELVVLKLS
jgi:release factor glutamine methyltransferase